ncbi:MAG TPA: hypothetical protein VN181_13150 [Thermoanaerobaculia bacterium]|nr:hypothetical protein [Thermoanaerobaculia bacterium]
MGVLGAAYVVLALSLLAWYLVESWNSSGMLDRAMQFMLLVAAITGAWFIWIARTSLSPGGWHHFFGGRGSQAERRVVR